jgi:hypothetical protein
MEVACPDGNVLDGELNSVFAWKRAEVALDLVEFSYYVQRSVLPITSRVFEPYQL